MAGTSSNIPTGVISNEENVSTEADLSSAACFPVTSAAIPAIRSPTPTPQLLGNAESIQSDSVQAKQRVFMCAKPDIEDCGNLLSTQKKSRADDTLFHRFRGRRGLFVTDVTKTEWCEKQMELSLFHEQRKNNEAKRGEERCSQKQIDLAIVFGGGRKNNKAIKAGIDRHVELQLEVLTPVSVKMKSREDYMAVKLVNFINGVNQLCSDGLTREIPIVSFDFVQGIWMVGKIDEVQMPKVENDHNPILVETKTRSKEEVPSEPQKRKGRIQLMCYKYLWDNLVAHAHHDFPSKQLYEYFELNSQHILCEDLKAV